MFMKLRFIIPLISCILLTISSAGAVWGSALDKPLTTASGGLNIVNEWAQADHLTRELYHAARAGNRQAGFLYAQKLQGLLEKTSLLAPDKRSGIMAMYRDAEQIKEALMSGDPAVPWLQEAARLMLAGDVLVRPDNALWLQYESVMLDDWSRVEKGWKRQTEDRSQAARAAMNSLQEHARRIEPAYTLLYGADYGAELHERIAYTNKLLEGRTTLGGHDVMINDALKALREAIVKLYDQSRHAETLAVFTPPLTANPFKWAFMLGAVISAVLAYKGWSKYKAEPYGVKRLR
jgi:hypothetical protein